MPIPRLPALLFLVAAQAGAQDPWAPVRHLALDSRSPDTFKLVTTDPPLNFAWYGEHSLGASDGRELFLLSAGKGKANEALTRILKGPGWALFDPSANRIGEGTGLPTPEKVQELMEGAGWKPLREGLKAHLRQNPDDGQAWLELAFDIARQGMLAKPAGALSPALRTKLREELLPCLQKLVEISDSAETMREPRPQPFATMLLYVKYTELDQDPSLKNYAKKLQAAVPKLITQDPENRTLWQATSWTNDPEEEEFGLLAQRNLFAALEGVPRNPWPPLFLANYFTTFYWNRPEEAFQIASRALARSKDPRVECKLGRAHVLQALREWGSAQFMILLSPSKLEEATALLGSLRLQAGKGWPGIASRFGETLELHLRHTEEHKSEAEPGLNPQKVETLRQALQEPPVADPPAPDCSPLRLALLEGPSDPLVWGKLQIHEALMPWGPSELSWQPLKKDEAARIRERHGWSQGQRWLLMKKDEVLASGPGIPSPTVLETALRGQGTPELEELGAFIKTHPERLDARRARLGLLRARLPNPRLESLFLQDLEATGEPIGSLPFDPDPEVWGPVARRVGFRCTERLRNWPFNTSAWTCYASWSALDSELPRPATLLSTLETWPRQRALRLPGPVPLAASKAVIEVLRDQGRHGDLDAWMRVLWERGLKSWVAQWSALQPLGRNNRGGWLDRDAPEVKLLMAAWGEALTKRGDKAQLKALQEELEDLQRGLSRALLTFGDLRRGGSF